MSHDSSYKLLFSHPEMVRDLLQGFVHEEWVAQCDFSTLEKVSGSYVSDDLRAREDDVIWRVRWGSNWLYVYLLLEFQSTVDFFMAVRVMGYIALLYQDLVRSGQVTRQDKLPPVFPVVLYNGEPRWWAPVTLDALIHPAPPGLEKYRPQLSFLLLDEGCFQQEELNSLNNLVAALFLLENSRNEQDIQRVLEHLLDWLHGPSQTSLRRAFTVWIGRVLLPAKVPGVEIPEFNNLKEVQSMLAERVKQWVEDWKQQGLSEGLQQGLEQGLEQGLQQGLKQGRVNSLLKQLSLKFGELPDWVGSKLEQASGEQLELWLERILTAQSLDEFFQ